LFMVAVCVYACQWFVAVMVGIDIQAGGVIRAGFLNHS
jgi:hypothetical protein